jgi:ankyrin repeat protein
MIEQDSLKNIASRIHQYAPDSADLTTDVILIALKKHTDADSYKMGQALKQSLQALDARFLQNPEVTSDTKTLIAVKLMEEINACTPGFHNRVERLLIMKTGVSQQFTDILQAIRQDIVEQVAVTNIHHTPLGNQVHAYNDFYTVASKKYNTAALNSKDPHHGSLPTQQIKIKLAEAFQNEYDLFGCLMQLEHRIRSELNTLGAYKGELDGQETSEKDCYNAYKYGSYDAFIAHLNKILEPSPLFTAQNILVSFKEKTPNGDEVDTYRIIDIHWPVVREKMYEKMTQEHDFLLAPDTQALVQCFFHDSMDDTYAWLNALSITGFDFSKSFEALHDIKALNFFQHWSWEKQLTWINYFLDNTTDINLKLPKLFCSLDNIRLLEFLPIEYDQSFFNCVDKSDHTPIVRMLYQNNKEKLNFLLDKLKLLPQEQQKSTINSTLNSLESHGNRLCHYPAVLDLFRLLSTDIMIANDRRILLLAAHHSEQALNIVLDLLNTFPTAFQKIVLTHKTQHGYNALILAAQIGAHRSIPRLLNMGINIESHDANQSTALHWAANNGHVDAVNCLLNNHALLEAKGAGEHTTLHFAVIHGQAAVVDLLLKKKPNINARDNQGKNSLDLAIEQQPELIEPLLMHMATRPFAEQETCLSHMNAGAYPNVLFYAAAQKPSLFDGLLEVLQQHHQPPAAFLSNTNAQGYNALILAAQAGAHKSIPILLDLGLDIESHDANQSTALHWAANNGHVDAVNCLLNNHALLEAKGAGEHTTLNFAVIHGQAAVVDLLLKKKPNINARDNQGRNSLDLAIERHPELIEPLLMHMATRPFAEQETCLSRMNARAYPNVLFYAAAEKPLLFDDLLEVLQQHHQPSAAFLSNTNAQGYNALILAAQAGAHKSIQALLDLGLDIESRDINKRTALNWAAEKRHRAAVDVLLEKNANINACPLSSELLSSINHMREYGQVLNGQGSSKGQIAIDLADELKLKAEAFFNKQGNQPDFPTFKQEFLSLLNSKNKEMSEYRVSWDTIIKNIAIALTGVGVLFIAAKLLYSQATQGRALFFFQKDKTTCEEKTSSIEQSMNNVERFQTYYGMLSLANPASLK